MGGEESQGVEPLHGKRIDCAYRNSREDNDITIINHNAFFKNYISKCSHTYTKYLFFTYPVDIVFLGGGIWEEWNQFMNKNVFYHWFCALICLLRTKIDNLYKACHPLVKWDQYRVWYHLEGRSSIKVKTWTNTHVPRSVFVKNKMTLQFLIIVIQIKCLDKFSLLPQSLLSITVPLLTLQILK